jgi:nucleotidyltransferase substrate binding protein (TIGR01987 family)
MNDNEDIRWKQRFENYEKAYLLLEKAAEIKNPSETERAGMIQFFEMAFELSWKLLKDYLAAEGYVIKSPRQAIKQAAQAEVIKNSHQWLDALEDRNLTVHTYHEETAVQVEDKIRNSYLPLLRDLYIDFKSMMESA